MCICQGCGKIIQKEFFYCPWCGYSKINQENNESQRLHLEMNEEKMRQNKLNQIEKLEEELDNLERELSVLVLSAEMHK
ncbi:MAG: hypothetical protein K6D95_09525 [Treponema sp.]|jgi:uncharacterized Zn finger protein (UPF0148 family)|nr:hypothetical protein [Treponema sp.]